MFYLALRHVTIKITTRGLDRQFQETRSMFLRNMFSGYMFFLCMIFKERFPRIKSLETTHAKKIIKSCLRKNCHIE